MFDDKMSKLHYRNKCYLYKSKPMKNKNIMNNKKPRIYEKN